ncbi:MAG TPA: formate dehydrogenase subunit delta [Burkholderiaceae bacterium]|nr:formate dehydrogenase subunit delta [Burkholderiaceae bacterium]
MKNIDGLIQKANRIGRFFEAMPDRADGLAGIADHIQKFWEPRMRLAMLEFLAEHPDGRSDGAQLDAMVLESINRYRDRLQPRTEPA